MFAKGYENRWSVRSRELHRKFFSRKETAERHRPQCRDMCWYRSKDTPSWQRKTSSRQQASQRHQRKRARNVATNVKKRKDPKNITRNIITVGIVLGYMQSGQSSTNKDREKRTRTLNNWEINSSKRNGPRPRRVFKKRLDTHCRIRKKDIGEDAQTWKNRKRKRSGCTLVKNPRNRKDTAFIWTA